MFQKRLKDDAGQVLVLTLISMAVLLGFVALAIDVGALFHEKRNLQIVADAAATAGALDYYKDGKVAYARTAAQQSVAINGLAITSGNWTTSCPGTTPSGTPASFGCVSTPPSTGSHSATGFVEVQVSQPNRTTLMGMFGFGNLYVATRAVAGPVPGQACVYVQNNLNVQGNASLCGAAVGATITSGFCGTGNSCGTAAPAACGVYAGSITGTGGGGGSNCIDAQYVETPASSAGVSLNPSPAATGVPTQSPPSWVTNPPSPQSNCNLPAGGTWGTDHGVHVYTATLTGTLSAGCYGMANEPSAYVGNSDMNLTINGANLNSGLYQFDLGSVKIGNGASAVTGGTLTLGSNVCNSNYNGGTCTAGGSLPPNYDTSGASGVTLDINTGNFSVSSTSTNINLFAPSDLNTISSTTSLPSSDGDNGVLLWEPASNTGSINIQWGSANSNFYGYIVALGSTVTMQDQGGGAIVSGLYVGNLSLNSTLGVSNYSSVVANGPGKTIALVE